MALTNQRKNQHLLWRAGFGPAVEQTEDLVSYQPRQFFRSLTKASANDFRPLTLADGAVDGLMMGLEEAGRLQKGELSAEEKKKFQQASREGIRSLNLAWIREMVNSAAQLREKAAFFWHGHFACRNLNVFYQQGLLDIIRQYALGDFRTMLKEVSRSAAMLNFLNNQQNRKDHPNENFAREVMELFTLGRGHYTETDVKEAARAFTGWGANLKGEFVFRRFQHDGGSKTLLGKTGNFDGEDVLNILLEQPQTARFIAAKAYRFFVNEQPDEGRIDWLAARFFASDYSISGLLEDIFTSDWFYEERHMGTRIKSPVELVVGIQRLLPMTIENEEALILVQRVLGQVLFYPPNVAGWPGGRNWIDSSSLMMRMRLPQLINDQAEMPMRPKDDDDQMMGRRNADRLGEEGRTRIPARQQINARVNWDPWFKALQKWKREQLVQAMTGLVLQSGHPPDPALILQYADASSREAFIRSATIRLMCTPEYQLC